MITPATNMVRSDATRWMKHLPWIGRGMRLIFGIMILALLLWGLPSYVGRPTDEVLTIAATPPFAFFVIPLVLTALYFVLSLRLRLHVDALVLLVLVFCGYNVIQYANKLATESIKGNESVRVIMTTVDQRPVPGIEVHFANKPGMRPYGGIEWTDANGIAQFMLKPGSYYLSVDLVKYPSTLEPPVLATSTIMVIKDAPIDVKVLLKIKEVLPVE